MARPQAWLAEQFPGWTPDIATPPFPSYPSGHATVSGAAATVLAAAKIAGAVPVTPGGLGPVEAAMVAAFVSTGVDATTAAAAVVAYRIISFALMTVIGWIIYIPKSWGWCSRTQP